MTDQQKPHNDSDHNDLDDNVNDPASDQTLNQTTDPTTALPSAKVLAEPRTSQRRRLQFSLVWIIPIIALVIGISLVVKAVLDTGPTITVTFRTADGLQAGKTTVRFKEVDIGVVKNIGLADDHSHVIVKIELTRAARSFAVDDARFWVVRPRVGTGGISGIGTLFSGAYIGLDGGKSEVSKESFTGLETPPAIAADVPGTTYTLQSTDLGSLDVGSSIYYRRINVGQVSAYQIAADGKSVQLQIFIQSPYDRYVTTDTRFWHASGLDVSLSASGFKVNTQSIASIVAGGIAFGFPEDSNADTAKTNTLFTLAQNEDDALKKSDGKPIQLLMYFDQSVRGLSKGSSIDFRGIELGTVQSINVEFDSTFRHFRMPVVATIYPSRLSQGREFDPNQMVLAEFIQRGLRAQMRTGNILTGQNYIALDFFPKAKPAQLKFDKGIAEIPTTATELSNLQAQVSKIADKLAKFPLNEIGQDLRKTMANMNTTIVTTNKLVKQMDGKIAPAMQATLDDARKTMQSTQSVLASDAPLQQDVRRAMQQLTRAAASVQLMADYIEQHPESIIRGKAANQDKNQDKNKP